MGMPWPWAKSVRRFRLGMTCSASGTYSLPSAFMKSYWVSTSQKITRAMAVPRLLGSRGNLSAPRGHCQPQGHTAAPCRRGEGVSEGGTGGEGGMERGKEPEAAVSPGARGGGLRTGARRLQPQHHRNLVATVLSGAPRAIGPHLEGEVLSLGAHEAELLKECGFPGQGEQLREAVGPGFRDERVHDDAPDPRALPVGPHGEARDFAERT